ncbi:TnsD family Tn7-like transposition protein [Variovorax sp. J31P207]|uniref:TnsD family Tn7-like transposition protein n=1 Tax=Variovorax sp. J31P207 TaxID=3053510 RepID=UPI00257498A3|nr:TnsD family Tn7-like transposition protein [Variovorax sp. J31P207]MDM0065228.1 TnsD family Tn7-like transposition protein [Variovorax sp. J31P207]
MRTSDQLSLLCWLPDESLYSLCSRQHRFWGFRHASETCERLFGAPLAGTHHDLPNHLAELAIRTDSAWGAAHDLAQQRTLLKFYATFLREENVNECVDAMAGDSVAHLRFRLGLCASRFGTNHPLKACLACIDDDVESKGWPYWHLEHQYPGVWVCRKHEMMLRESLLKSTGLGRFQWQLPAKEQLRARLATGSFGIDEPTEQASIFARLIVELTEWGGRIGVPRLRPLYIRKLDQLGLVTPGGRVRIGSVANDLLSHSLSVRPVAPELGAFPSNLDEVRANMERLLRPTRSSIHPLRHILMISWLFRDAATFFDAYAELPDDPVDVGQDLGATNLAQYRIEGAPEARSASIRTEKPQGTGLSGGILRVSEGSDLTTTMADAGRVATRRGPWLVKGKLRQQLITKLAAGSGAQVLSVKYKVSKTTIYDLLRTEPDLLDTWTEARDQQVLDRARQRWLYAVEKHGHLGLQRVRMLESAAYTRLYRQDRAWLDQHKPPRVKMDFGRRKGVSWPARDLVLSAQVQRALDELAMTRSGDRWHLWQICQAVPEVKAKLRVLDRLPLTRQVVDAALGRGVNGSSIR